MFKTRDEYIASTKHQPDELNKKMNQLEAKTDAGMQEARDAYNAEMAKLRAQSKLAMDKFEAFKQAGDAAWDKSVAEMEKYRDAFSHPFAYFKSRV